MSEKLDKRPSCKQICWSQLFAVVVFALGLAAGVCIGVFGYQRSMDDEKEDKMCVNPSKETTKTISANTDGPQCPNRNPVTKRSYEDSIYAPLTANEMNKVLNFLYEQGIVSTKSQLSSITENFLLYQWIYPPKKSEALDFIDSDGVKPKRYAHATVQRGGVPSPDLMEYKVGPLNGGQMNVKSLTRPGDIHFNTRPYEMVEGDILTKLLDTELKILAPLIAESFDGAQHPRDTYINLYNGPPSTSGRERNIR